MNLQELRRAAIDLLLSMLSLPLHFLNQPLPSECTAHVGWGRVGGRGSTGGGRASGGRGWEKKGRAGGVESGRGAEWVR